jgi:acyl-coenzyme A thioesterase PaaI-like protein
VEFFFYLVFYFPSAFSASSAALAVTTDLTFHFLRRPQPADLVAESRLLSLHPKLAVGEVRIFSEGLEVTHAVGSYALPQSPNPR